MSEAEDTDPVDALAADYVERLRRGEAVRLEDYRARHPHLASEIDEVFPMLAALEGIKEAHVAATPDTGTPDQVGDFRIVRQIGRGGMGTVYEAEQLGLQRRVAVKLLTRSSPVDRERFAREARLAAALQHPAIVPVYAFGEADGRPWYAMRLIEGWSWDRLSAALRGSDPDSAATKAMLRHGTIQQAIVHCTAVLARALAYAHEYGVLHRDIKPANLLLDREGAPWIADFGLARPFERDAGPGRSRSSVNLPGTLRYMAPEQFRHEVDQRSDVYALGLSCFEMLAGRPAFALSPITAISEEKTATGTPALRSVLPDVDPALARIIDRAGHHDPEQRFQQAQDLAEALEGWLQARQGRRPRAAIWALAAVTLLTLLGLIVVLAGGHQSEPREPTANTPSPSEAPADDSRNTIPESPPTVPAAVEAERPTSLGRDELPNDPPAAGGPPPMRPRHPPGHPPPHPGQGGRPPPHPGGRPPHHPRGPAPPGDGLPPGPRPGPPGP